MNIFDESKFSGREITLIPIGDISIGERFRKKFYNIDSLAESIQAIGLQNPIILNEKKELVSGGRRLEAFKLMGWDTAPARIVNIDDTLDAEIDENNQREPFTVSEKVSIAEALAERIGERRGKKKQAIDSKQDENVDNSPHLEKSRDWIAKKAGFGNSYTFRQAKSVLSDAIPEVVDAMDSGIVSVNFAHKVSQLPKKKQLTALNEATAEVDTDTSALNEANNTRRKAKRKEKKQEPKNPIADPIYSIVRVAPNFWDDLMSDIEETPIHNYLNPTSGVLAIEVPNQFIDKAIHLVTEWGLTYIATVTVWCKKAPEESHIEYLNRQAMHLIIARIDADTDPGFDWVDPVYDRQNQFEAMEEIIDMIWPNKDILKIDMTSVEPREGWAVWKIDYTPDQPETESTESEDTDE